MKKKKEEIQKLFNSEIGEDFTQNEHATLGSGMEHFNFTKEDRIYIEEGR